MATKIKVTTNPDGYMKIEAEGHTDSKVCAAVSTLLQSSVRFLQDLEEQFPHELSVQIIEKDK
ncbi:ribosomal-processing cysteine protease Prp [Lysinibacillus capsici]|uniref:ribosomal-processing cysteine protease Prp n=1 Tax=Lysinibacillus capsici TaxID=2115968 RepID=UPI0028AEC858|nr:ribosomal-processing cysteine protease Prp [Lysinibacillus capsici]